MRLTPQARALKQIGFAIFLLSFLTAWKASAQGIQVTKSEISGGKVKITFSPRLDSYYILFKGSAVTSINSPAALTLPASTLIDPTPVQSAPYAFFRLREV